MKDDGKGDVRHIEGQSGNYRDCEAGEEGYTRSKQQGGENNDEQYHGRLILESQDVISLAGLEKAHSKLNEMDGHKEERYANDQVRPVLGDPH